MLRITSIRTVLFVFAMQVQLIDDVDYERLTKAMQNATKIIYNRVPKCGSTTVRRALKRIAVKTRAFKFIGSKEHHNQRPRETELQSLVKQLKSTRAPWLYDRHLHFIEFDRYHLSDTLYINVVRRPVDRFFSWYYFIRFQHRLDMPDTVRRRPFEKCVKENYKECSELHSFHIGSVPYFCGQSEVCMKPSQAAVDRAKQNINKYFGVVGLTRDMVHTIALLEQTSPHIFRNMTQFASYVIINGKRINKANTNYTKDPAVMAIMNERMTYENQLYEFIKQRFYAFLVHFKTDAFLQRKLLLYLSRIAGVRDGSKRRKWRELAERVRKERSRIDKSRKIMLNSKNLLKDKKNLHKRRRNLYANNTKSRRSKLNRRSMLNFKN